MLGLGVVVIGALLLVMFIKSKTALSPVSQPTQEVSSTKTQKVEAQKKINTYTVAAGETLWSIAEKQYKSGYNWIDIARANKLQNPDVITAGTTLTLPVVEIKTVKAKQVVAAATTVEKQEKSETAQVVETKITADKYTVKSGEFLWDIAVRAYGDGYKWVEIAKANNLANPDMIFSGNELKLPR